MIKLQITKTESNEQYEIELKEYQERSRYMNYRPDNSDYPQKEKMSRVLEVWVTEEQFEKIRKAVLENF